MPLAVFSRYPHGLCLGGWAINDSAVIAGDFPLLADSDAWLHVGSQFHQP